ncbi:MAG: ABC transporter substrate-binding protein [Deltaproteobacteria bacterium]|nr:ABC transporter substrate-binding protein [Deltaproteobacteria bacterium]MBW2051874.1 ABC transporter substrate-binding protein [Deltaproteobacteria bacterium]MBW2141229.1 ABC transporter substrate-binding protein [Deltaproteobacteria bacterium]MBW2323611.1 ABC transporter substrate-binding protein [Deltaproteobacteria bacterium]
MTKRFLRLIFSSLLVVTLLLGFSILPAGAEEPKYGGTLKVLHMGTHLNPMAWDNNDWNWKHGNDTGFYLEHLFSGDLQKGPRGTNEYPFQASAWIPPEFRRGELVESWEIEKDPLALVFHLRKNVYWQEKPGVMKARQFVADDVVYNFTRLAKSPKAIPLYLEFIDHWEARDKHTAVAYLKEWNSNWYYRFGWGYYDAVQPPEMEKAGARDWKNACGTGPYMITEYKTGHSQTYTKNPKYWDTTIINGKKYQLPFTDQVKELLIKDESTRYATLRTGKVDLMMNINWKYKDTLTKQAPKLKWSRALTLGGFMIALRMDTKPFDDIRVRRALNMAVNQQEIIDSFYGGNAELVNYPFPRPFSSVFTPIEKLPDSAKELFSYNPEKAKKLLAEAGYPNGFTFKAQISTASQEGLDLASMVVAYLAKVNVKLVLETMDYPSYLSKMTSKTHGPGYFFSNDHGNPYATIRKNFLPKQTWNPYMIDDDYITNTYKETISNPNLSEKEQFDRMKKLAVYCIDQAPAIWLPGPYFYQAWWPWVKNYYGELRVGAWRAAPIFARIWIDQDLKKKMGYK